MEYSLDEAPDFDIDDNVSSVGKEQVAPVNDSEVKKLKIEKAEKVISCLLDSLVGVSEVLEKNSKLGKFIYESALRTMSLATKGLLRWDLNQNQVEPEFTKENLSRRPYLEIVVEGVNEFKKNNPDRQVKFVKDGNYISTTVWIETFNSKVNSEEFSEELIGIYGSPVENKKLGVVLIDALKKGKMNQVLNLVKRRFPQVLDRINQHQFDVVVDSRVEEDMMEEILLRSESDVPVSASKIISVCMEYVDGNVTEALQLAGACMKYGAREKPKHGGHYWVKNNLLDEYSEFNSFNGMSDVEYIPHTADNRFNAKSSKVFGKLSEVDDENIYYDTSYKNRIGLPYHASDLASLLDTFSPECILFMMFGEYLTFGRSHGVVKFLSDLRVAGDLYDIKAYLESLQNT